MSSGRRINFYDLFRWACWGGQVDLAKWLASASAAIDVHAAADGLDWACGCGRVETVKWLLSAFAIPGERKIMSFTATCGSGHLETAKWLHTTLAVDVHVCRDLAFVGACSSSCWETAKWLYNLDPEWPWPAKELTLLKGSGSLKRHTWILACGCGVRH